MRLDGWAMKRSWSNPLVSGYEVKVSRSDFLRDDKWMAYLPLCNELYFVCPSGLIEPHEIGENVGLLWAAKTGGRLFTKKKAVWRNVVVPEEVYRYILMSRTRIVEPNAPMESSRERRMEECRAFLAAKAEDKSLGWTVGKAVREHVRSVRQESEALKAKMLEYDELLKMLGEMGISPNAWQLNRRVKDRLSELNKVIPVDLEMQITRLSQDLKRVQETIERAKKEAVDTLTAEA